MTYTPNPPNTVFLGGLRVDINDLAAGAAITPGHLIERYVPSGTINRVRVHSTAGGGGPKLVAIERTSANKGPDDAYAAGDLVDAVALPTGGKAWMFIASGQSITHGQKLESAGDGTLRAYASGVILFSALETVAAANTGLTRIRVEAV